MEFNEIVLKFVIVFVLTFIYGIYMQKSHKPVGFGTFILVAIGACAMSIVAYDMGIPNSISLLAAIITGIGFLGAGALIRGSEKIFGFTTAASIWLFAIFGVVIGIGEYRNGLILYFLAWIVIVSDRYLETKGLGSYRRKIVITSNTPVDKKEITNILSEYCTRFNLLNINMNKKDKKISMGYTIEGPRKDIEFLIKEFYKKRWCISVFFE